MLNFIEVYVFLYVAYFPPNCNESLKKAILAVDTVTMVICLVFL